MRPLPASDRARVRPRPGPTTALLALVALTLSACGGGDEPAPAAGGTSSPAVTTAAPTPAPTPTATSAAPAPSEDPGTGTDTGSVGTGPGTSGSAGDLAVVITFAQVTDGSLEVGAYVDGVIEENGTCTLTARSGATTRQDSHAGVADASTTSCGTLTADVTSGSWSVAVEYDSPSGEGRATTTVVAP